jgi:hypothetical protein
MPRSGRRGDRLAARQQSLEHHPVPDRMPLVRLQTIRATVLGKTSAAVCRLPEMFHARPLPLCQILSRNFQHLALPSAAQRCIGKLRRFRYNAGTTGIAECLFLIGHADRVCHRDLFGFEILPQVANDASQ